LKIKIIDKNKLIVKISKEKGISTEEAQQIYADMPIKERKRQIRGWSNEIYKKK